MGRYISIGLAVVLFGATLPTQALAPQVERPLGTWEREIGPYRITIQIEADKLHGTFVAAAEKSEKMTVSIHADYSMTKDSILFGVITDLEVTPLEKELESTMLFVDQPFSFRFRADGDKMTIKDIKFMGLGKDSGKDSLSEEIKLVMGRYKKTKGIESASFVPPALAAPADSQPEEGVRRDKD